MPTEPPRNTLTTLQRGFDVVHFLMESDGARVSEVAEGLNLALSTAHKYLATLHADGYVVKEGDEYHVGLRFLTIGGYAKYRKKSFEVAARRAETLAEETGERVQFIVEEHGRGIYHHIAAGESTAMMTNRCIGESRHLHSSAGGKAILAFLPSHRLDEIIDRRGLPRETEHTITNREELEEELERVRSTGVAYNDEESIVGLRAVAVPVTEDGRVIGSLSLSGSSYRLKDEKYREEVADRLLAAANEVELTVTYS